jgi:transposase
MEQMITDSLWSAFEPLIPKHRKSSKGGRPPVDDRKCLEGLVYVLRTGTPWHLFPKKEFGVSKSTVYDRFTAWTQAGVFLRVHRRLLNELGLAGKIDLSTAVIDSGSVRAVFGGYILDQVPWIAAKAG